jgi:hypothetical protein
LFELQVFLKPQVQRKRKTRKAATQVTIIETGVTTCLWKTDADAVLACYTHNVKMIFLRIEMNYIEKLGRLSEIKGQSVLYNDLETRLIIDEKSQK